MMNRFRYSFLGTAGALLLFASNAGAQSLDQAKKLYNQGEYEQAKPAFEKLIKTSPNNSSYNQWYGVCCFETGDLEAAEKPLQLAAKRKIPEAYRYLGDLYYLTYRFEEAAGLYENYIEFLGKKKMDATLWEQKLERARKGARMLNSTEDVAIIDSLIVDKDRFLSAYQLSGESGSLMPLQEFFQNADTTGSVVYMNEKQDRIYYARPTGDNRLCLYTQSRLMDKWGDEKALPMTVNTNDDDNYPFLLSDGVTLYFASKGNGSLGGYDLFVTRYNTNSDTYLTPEQMGMPFNSPYNDYMLVIDEAKGLGWFVTDRFQPEGKAVVYLFIPNDERIPLETDDTALKRDRARIASIRDSWKNEAAYADLIRLAYTRLPSGPEQIRKDFEFVITDERVYYTLEEIQSPEARSHYEKAWALRKQIGGLEEKLETLRTEYIHAGATEREKLATRIVRSEQELEALASQPADWETKARNAEIRYLRNQR